MISEPITQTSLLTNLYQPKMLQGYFDRGMQEIAVFEFFCPEVAAAVKLPDRRRLGTGPRIPIGANKLLTPTVVP